MRNFAQASQLPRIHGEQVSRLRRTRSVSQYRHAAIGRLERNTFESDFYFVVVDLNVLDFYSESVYQRCIGREVHDAKIWFSTFTVQECQRVSQTFFDRIASRVITTASQSGRICRTVNAPERVSSSWSSDREPCSQTRQCQVRRSTSSASRRYVTRDTQECNTCANRPVTGQSSSRCRTSHDAVSAINSRYKNGVSRRSATLSSRSN